MRVLFACPWVPWPLTNGGKTRTYHLLRQAARRAEVHVRLVREPDTAPDAAAELAEFCASVEILDRTSPGPVRRWTRAKIERWFHSDPLRAALQRDLATGAFDVLHLDEPLLTRSVPAAPRTAVVVHHHKLDTVLYDALGAGTGPLRHFDLFKLRRLERYAARRFPHQVLCSEDDAAILRHRHGDLDFGVVPSGYDEEQFHASDPPPPRDPGRVLFLGSMDYGPNVDAVRWFVSACLPALRARRPGVVLEVIGRHPGPEVRSLAGEGVVVTGEVPEVPSHLERCAVFLVPLRIGGGTRLKLVEALALGAPTVSTTIGAEGLGLEHGKHLLLADDPPALVDAVDRLLADPAAARALGERGRAFAHDRYRWGILGEHLVDYWKRAAESAT